MSVSETGAVITAAGTYCGSHDWNVSKIVHASSQGQLQNQKGLEDFSTLAKCCDTK